MARFRSKVREIEAVRYEGEQTALPFGFQEYTSTPGKLSITCYTLNGPVRAERGDWLILGEGEVYPCKPEEFEKRYEAIDGV